MFISIIFNYVYMCGYGNVHMYAGAWGGQRCQIPLELKLHMVVSHHHVCGIKKILSTCCYHTSLLCFVQLLKPYNILR